MDSRSRIEVQARPFGNLRAPFLSFFAILLSLLAGASPVAALAPRGSYVPLISLFIDGIRDGLLPANWILIAISPNEPLEVDVVASLVLALLLSSPVIAYQVMKIIASVRATQRVLYSLTAVASLLLASGALFAYIFFPYVLAATTPFFLDVGMARPLIDFANFYLLALGAIAAGAVVFTLPVYIYALVRFRR